MARPASQVTRGTASPWTPDQARSGPIPRPRPEAPPGVGGRERKVRVGGTFGRATREARTAGLYAGVCGLKAKTRGKWRVQADKTQAQRGSPPPVRPLQCGGSPSGNHMGSWGLWASPPRPLPSVTAPSLNFGGWFQIPPLESHRSTWATQVGNIGSSRRGFVVAAFGCCLVGWAVLCGRRKRAGGRELGESHKQALCLHSPLVS